MFKELEDAYDQRLPAHTYAAVRVDGKNFSRFTKPMRTRYPFSNEFTSRMILAARSLADEVSGAVCVFTQSDEISVIFQDLEPQSEKWMGGRVSKITSLAAALASVSFNTATDDLAIFDARTFDLGDDPATVVDYLMERHASGVRNSIGMLASHHFPHKKLMGMGTNERRLLLAQEGHPWEDVDPVHRFGTLLYKKPIMKTTEFTVDGVTQTAQVYRKVWHKDVVTDAPEMFEAVVASVA